MTAGSAYAAGALLGAVLPARGPAALIAGLACTVPILWQSKDRLDSAFNECNRPGAKLENVGRALSKDRSFWTW